MKIVDKNKDYYDYLMGVYGIDPLAVFDRRGSEFINLLYAPNLGRMSIDEWIDYFANPIKDRRGNLIRYPRESGVIIGDEFYILGVVPESKRGKNELGEEVVKMKFEFKEKRKIDRDEEDPRPLVFIDSFDHDYDENGEEIYTGKYIWSDKMVSVEKVPILVKTNFSSILPAEEIFTKIQDWILTRNDKPIVDTRTDVEKLESHGFDKRTSFRKRK